MAMSRYQKGDVVLQAFRQGGSAGEADLKRAKNILTSDESNETWLSTVPEDQRPSKEEALLALEWAETLWSLDAFAKDDQIAQALLERQKVVKAADELLREKIAQALGRKVPEEEYLRLLGETELRHHEHQERRKRRGPINLEIVRARVIWERELRLKNETPFDRAMREAREAPGYGEREKARRESEARELADMRQMRALISKVERKRDA